MPGKLTYFPLGARGECIRAVCFLGKLEYENNIVTQEEFGALKESGELPMGSLPIWQENDTTLCQSSAILRMLGIRLGFYTTDADTAWRIDSLVDFMEDNYGSVIGTCIKPIFGSTIEADDKTKYLAYFDKVIPVLNARLEQHGKPWIAGTDNITIADLKVFQTFTLLVELDQCPMDETTRMAAKEKCVANPKLFEYLRNLRAYMEPWLAARAPTPC